MVSPFANTLGSSALKQSLVPTFSKIFLANLTDFFGGRSNTYEKVLREGKETVIRELEQQAARMGANAIVGVDIDYNTVGANGSMLMVVATGTAVVL